MKTRTRELAKPGIYGTIDDPKVVIEKDLIEIAETFGDVGKAPISLHGHWPDPHSPRLGNVISVSYDTTTKTLIGTIEEQDVLAKAVDEGSYPDVSIGAKRRASDGKMYLHHLAYLGEEPPAIKNLISDITKSLNEEKEAPDGIAAADSGALIELPSPCAVKIHLSDGKNSKQPKEAHMKTPEELQEELAVVMADNTKMREKFTVLAAKYPEDVNLSDSEDPRVSMLLQQIRSGRKAELVRAAAGKIPKAKESLVVALADSFTTGEIIELSDGDKKVKKTQFDVLSELFQSMPRLVEPGKLDLSDGTGDPATNGGKIATIPFSKA